MTTRSLSVLLTTFLGCLLLTASCAKPTSGGDPGTGGTTGSGGTGMTCGAGQMNCNGQCRTVATDNQNCGACGTTCGAMRGCQNGQCVCNSGLLDCSGSCVPSDATHCGSCTNACPNGQVCSGTTCSTSCTGATPLMCGNTCVQNGGDGTTQHCGGCNACPSGATACTNGTCACSAAGQMLCSGACVDTTMTNSHCGSCTNVCPIGTQCMNSNCVSTGGTGGTGGTTGAGGTTGTAGAGGTTGTAGAGGTTGTGGRGGTTGAAGASGTTGTGGAGGSGCTNTDPSKINEDASGYICNTTLGIKGAWYCYSDGADSTISCKGSDGKGNGAIPWNTTSSAMCLSGTMGTGSGSYAGIGFKVNSGPPGSTATPGTWNASSLVGFAITLQAGSSGRGSGGMILNLEFPTTTDMDSNTKDAPGITVPGVPTSGTITYNALFADAVLANSNQRHAVDPANLTDVKIAFFPDSISHSYDFCIKSVVPIMTAPNPVVASGNYGPTWNNQQPQAVNGINGYAVQSAPFPQNGNPMTMQVNVPSGGGVGFTYTTGSGFQAPNNGPGAFPAVISGWGPGHDGIQFYGPYKTAKTIGALTSITSNWSFTMGTSGNAVYDLWFGNSATPAVPNAELMIWIGNKDKMPIGYGTACGAAFNGRTPYCGTNGTGERVVSYWVNTGTNGSPVSNFDVLSYVKDAASHGYAGLSTGSYMIGLQTGFEVYSGSWTVSSYTVNIQ